MSTLKRLSEVYESALIVPFDDYSKIVLMSDCHRGDGSWADDFYKNRNIYYAALNHYHKNQYTYIELGDGDELWENKKFSEIMNVHREVFLLLTKFMEENRLYFIYGNHDIVKKTGRFKSKLGLIYSDERETMHFRYKENISFHEGLVLKHKETGNEIFLLHGHQADFFNDRLWILARFLVRYLWKPVELFGVNDPTSTAKNYIRKRSVEKKLIEWVKYKKKMLIAGHTHRPVFPEADEPAYFNDGSCVHPYSITAIEIVNGLLTLVKWCVKTKDDGMLYIDREVMEGPRKLKEYFEKTVYLSKNLCDRNNIVVE